MVRICLAAALLVAAGCSSTEIDVTLTIAPAVLAGTASSLHIESSEGWSRDLPLTRALSPTERLVYKTNASAGSVTLLVRVVGASGALGCGTGTATLGARIVALPISVDAGDCALAPPDDLGVDGGVDLAGDAGATVPSSCAQMGQHPEWLLCDGFDAPSLDSAWFPDSSKGEATIDATTFQRGTSSVRFHLDTAATPMDMGFDYEVARVYRTVSHTGALFVRVFVKLPASTVTHTAGNSTMLKLVDTPGTNGMFMSWNAGSTLGSIRSARRRGR